MTETHPNRPSTLGDLPPELLDHITSYLPTASCIANLGSTSKSLNAFVEKHAWHTFTRSRFPSLASADTPSWSSEARSLTTLSRAWDRMAIVARWVEPGGSITAFPGRKTMNRWTRPKGQTIGFTPKIDAFEEVGSSSQTRKEVLAFSAGAGICLRETEHANAREDVQWTTYRPYSAAEGRDDVTILHLLRSGSAGNNKRLVTGTANGDLQILSLPRGYDVDVDISYLTTQGSPVRSSSLLQDSGIPPLLAVNLGDTRVALYRIEDGQAKIAPCSEVDLELALRAKGNATSKNRPWSTSLLSRSHLAIGVGPAHEVIHVHNITSNAISEEPVRKIRVVNSADEKIDESLPNGVHKPPFSSIYTVVPLSGGTSSNGDGQVFLSGAYDGIVRLHDMRSDRQVESIYTDPAEDSAVYSLLPRGHEKVMVGTSRHHLVKVFDLRLGAKCYDWRNAMPPDEMPSVAEADTDMVYNLFLRPKSGYATRNDRSASFHGSSIYSLASPSPRSPNVYAGLSGAIMSLNFAEVMDPHPDPLYPEPGLVRPHQSGQPAGLNRVLDLAMYESQSELELIEQMGVEETRKVRPPQALHNMSRRDERWQKRVSKSDRWRTSTDRATQGYAP